MSVTNNRLVTYLLRFPIATNTIIFLGFLWLIDIKSDRSISLRINVFNQQILHSQLEVF